MHAFADNKGRQWSLVIDVPAIRDVRKALGVNLCDVVAGGELARRLSTDMVLLVDVLYVLCMDQAVKANVSDQEFGRALVGDSIDAAETAMVEELISFSPRRRRAVLTPLLSALKTMGPEQVNTLIENLTRLSVNGSTSSAGNAPGSAESTPSA